MRTSTRGPARALSRGERKGRTGSGKRKRKRGERKKKDKKRKVRGESLSNKPAVGLAVDSIKV